MIYIIAAFILSAAALYFAAAALYRQRPVFAAPGSRAVFIFLSVVWGLPMTLAGAFAALFLILTRHKPQKYGHCVLFEFDGISFGLALGPFIFAPKGDEEVKAHEHGHGIQNIYFGPFMPFCVGLPSVIRFWYRNLRSKTEKPCKTTYDHIWFEGSATQSGSEFILKSKNKEIKRNEQENARR